MGPSRQPHWFWKLGYMLVALVLSLMLHITVHPEPGRSLPSFPHDLMQQGLDAYQSGQFTQAINPLEQAVTTYARHSAPLNQALALSYLAQTYQELGHPDTARVAIESSVALLPSPPKRDREYQVQAQILNTYGELQFTWGQLDGALDTWKTADIFYQKLSDQEGHLGVMVNQIQALRGLGYYREAKQQAENIEAQLTPLPPSELTFTAWLSLGETQIVMGEYDVAKRSLSTSLTIAQSLRLTNQEATARLSLGNLERILGDRQLNQQLLSTAESLVRQSYCPDWSARVVETDADTHYQAAALYYRQIMDMTEVSLTVKVRSRLNHLSLTLTRRQNPSAIDLEATDITIQQISPSRFAVYAHVRFAQELACLPDTTVGTDIAILNRAIAMADSLDDSRAKSHALGSLGRLYEVQYQNLVQGERGHDIAAAMLNQAKLYTEAAMALAQQHQASDLSYRWQWQMGRLLRREGKRSEAIDYFSTAFKQLQQLRSDLVVLDTNLQFVFREQVEPLYRQFAELLLTSPNPSQAELRQARNVLEALQLAELDNFFQDACSDIKPEALDALIDQNDRQSAVLYSIIFPDHLDLILKLSGTNPSQTSGTTDRQTLEESGDVQISENLGGLKHYHIPLSSTELRDTILDFRRQLVRSYTLRAVTIPAQQLYEWLVQPIENDLRTQSIEHIVFVLDGILRNIPMAALYDGTQYLGDRYAISLSPGLQLFASTQQNQASTQLLAAGLSESVADFPALPNVEFELDTITKTVPTAIRLLNQEFTKSALRKVVKKEPISILHLATHGQFSSQVEDTFLLAYGEDNKITANELNEIIRNPDNGSSQRQVDLLVLSACQTARGDERAALGLAGVAVRAGARSTLATLWSVDDRATALLVAEFYRQLYRSDKRNSKVDALRQAQQFIRQITIKGNHPYEHPKYWAAFVLLGNWQ